MGMLQLRQDNAQDVVDIPVGNDREKKLPLTATPPYRRPGKVGWAERVRRNLRKGAEARASGNATGRQVLARS